MEYMRSGMGNKFPRQNFNFAVFAREKLPDNSEEIAICEDEHSEFVMIGFCGISVIVGAFSSNDVANVGYNFDEYAWGKGYGTECCRALIGYCFQEVCSILSPARIVCEDCDVRLRRVPFRCITSSTSPLEIR